MFLGLFVLYSGLDRINSYLFIVVYLKLPLIHSITSSKYFCDELRLYEVDRQVLYYLRRVIVSSFACCEVN